MTGPLFAHLRPAADQLVGRIAAHVEAALRNDPRDVVEFNEHLVELARLDPVSLRRVESIFASGLLATRLAQQGEAEPETERARRSR